jgi:hypothetical protein
MLRVEATELDPGVGSDLLPLGARMFEGVDVGSGHGDESAELELAVAGNELRLAGCDIGFCAPMACPYAEPGPGPLFGVDDQSG